MTTNAPTYRTTIEVCTGYHYAADGSIDGTYTEVRDIETDGSVYLDSEWADMTQNERDEADAWIREMHAAEVSYAECMPEVRAMADAILGDGVDSDWPADWASNCLAAVAAAKKLVTLHDYDEVLAMAPDGIHKAALAVAEFRRRNAATVARGGGAS